MLVRLIRLYQRHLSRYTPRCPESPSCSEFAIQAITEHGVRRGIDLAYDRLNNCGRGK